MVSMRRIALALALLAASQAALAGQNYPVTVRGGDERSFTPAFKTDTLTQTEAKVYDTVVIGGGLAGLTASVYLTDRGKSVLLLEKEPELGGLAAGGALSSGILYDRGAAYWTEGNEEEHKILERLNLGDYTKRYPISEPIDSYLWNGKLYLGIWEHETLEQLPASFALFKSELEHADEEGLIPNQPFEEAKKLQLDQLSATDWIHRMPQQAALRTDAESRKIYEHYQHALKAGQLPTKPMQDVIDLLELYCRSALGAPPEKVSAAVFANFYISEITTRYTSEIGTGVATHSMESILKARLGKTFDLRLKAPAASVKQKQKSVEVAYIQDGRQHLARAKFAVFAAELKFAPKIIEGLATQDPERAKLLAELGYSHYSVHGVLVKGHPYRATYDTWTRAADYTPADFTDVILGRWMDPKINGYEGMRNFEKDPQDDQGILSIYHPLATTQVSQGYSSQEAEALARGAVDRMIELYDPMLQQHWGTHIDVVAVETSRWPFSVHVAKPGHFIHDAKVLRKPFGRVFFANNNLGTPSFEEALFRGHCAANGILKRMDPKFKQERWTKCPID